jgi:hypothetical protein
MYGDAEVKTIYVPGTELFDRVRDLRAAGMPFKEALAKARQDLGWQYIFDRNLRVWRWVAGEQ